MQAIITNMFFLRCSNLLLVCEVWKLKEKFENGIMVMKWNGCVIYQKFYVGILFKWTMQLCIFIWTFQTAIFGTKIFD